MNANDANNLVYKELSYVLNGLLFSIHNALGRYCNEKQISDAIEHALKEQQLHYEREKVLPESFIGEKPRRNRVDFIVDDKILLEIKTTSFVGKEEYYQCRRYLQAYNKRLCLLVNFRDKHLRIKRILNKDATIA